jgi:hypothetical protein
MKPARPDLKSRSLTIVARLDALRYTHARPPLVNTQSDVTAPASRIALRDNDQQRPGSWASGAG